MASLWKRHDSKNFWACFTGPDGRRYKKSTGSANKREAQRLADGFEAVARKRQTAEQVRKVIQGLHREVTGEDMPEATVKEYVALWLADRKLDVTDNSYRFYSGGLERFLKWLGSDKADRPVADIGKDDLLGYKRNLAAAGLAPKTLNHALVLLRMVFRQAHRDGYMPADITVGLKGVKKARAEEGEGRRPFTLDELGKVLKAADDEWRSMVLFGLYTGQRLSDIATMRWASLDTDKAVVRLTTRKTGKSLILPMPAPLLRHIKSIAKPADPLAPVHPRAAGHLERTGRVAALSNQFGDLLAKAGLRARKRHVSEKIGRDAPRRASTLSFHCLRHTATSMMKNAGISSSAVQEFIGHDDAAMSRIYTHVSDAAMRDAAAALPDLGY